MYALKIEFYENHTVSTEKSKRAPPALAHQGVNTVK